MAFAELNWLAILVAVVAHFAFGMLYYSPVVLGKQWMRLAKVKMNKNKSMVGPMIGGLVTSFVAATVLGLLLVQTASVGVGAGAMLGFWIWLGFIATGSFGIVLWEGKPVKLWLLNNGYSLVGLLIMGAIIGAW